MATRLACCQEEEEELAKAWAECQLWPPFLRHQGGWRVRRCLETSENQRLLP